MAQGLRTENLQQIALVGEFAEYGHGGPFARILEINRVAEVHCECQTGDQGVDNADSLVPFPGKEDYQEDDKGVGVHYRRCVEHQAALQQSADGIMGEHVRKDILILQEISHTGNEKHSVREHKVQEYPHRT